jgi:hypothetical protein
MPPKVFISHASEDKARFVLAFAARLRAAGIDAWLDRWEMQPGDSLVRKLFDEGLQGADAVIVVLSRHSVEKPWVREELDAAFVKRVHSGSKLVPIVLDDCEVPVVLRTLVWERIDDLASYDTSFARIVAAITGAYDKPPLGAPPPAPPAVDGLAPVDARVLQAVGVLAVQQGNDLVENEALRASEALADLDDASLKDAVLILEKAGLVRSHFDLEGLLAAQLTTPGLQRVGQLVMSDYGALVPRVAAALVNQPMRDAPALAAQLGLPLFWIKHALDVLAERGDITLAKYGGGLVEVVDIGPGLRRALG